VQEILLVVAMSRPALGPTHLLGVMGVRVFSPGVKQMGHEADPSPIWG
jgi:hypothetical protein